LFQVSGFKLGFQVGVSSWGFKLGFQVGVAVAVLIVAIEGNYRLFIILLLNRFLIEKEAWEALCLLGSQITMVFCSNHHGLLRKSPW
jgi:hypothetical protein